MSSGADAGVRNLADLNQIAPNIEVSSANGTAPLANIYIRRRRPVHTGPNIDSGGRDQNQDGLTWGVLTGRCWTSTTSNSVQVLRGPQCSNIPRRRPGLHYQTRTSRRPSAAASATTDRADGNFMVNLPVTDSLWTAPHGRPSTAMATSRMFTTATST